VSKLEIHLLGQPRVTRDRDAAPHPRGHKAWGLLAYLLRTARAPSRAELVSLLFGEADDPLAALRWNLTTLRRLLGTKEARPNTRNAAALSGASFQSDSTVIADAPPPRPQTANASGGPWRSRPALSAAPPASA
jgi:DNA-binding SARP family transcriptional activator